MATEFEECPCIDFREYAPDPRCQRCGGTGQTIPDKILRVREVGNASHYMNDGTLYVHLRVDANWDVATVVMSREAAISLIRELLGVI